jgi:NADPH:quinone reductase-like Zn-dependent oxidoreductase
MKYKHIVISRFGGPENLSLVEDELREPQANEVRVKVLAAGVSLADILMREGVHPESWNLGRTPFTPGWDVVGVVDKLGDKVSTWQTGQMVAALPIVGGYSEYVFLSSNEIVPVFVFKKPSHLSFSFIASLTKLEAFRYMPDVTVFSNEFLSVLDTLVPTYTPVFSLTI